MTETLGDHLWQSTLFTLVAGALAWALRRNRAQVRHWLWMAASLKFVIPFAVLVAAGARLEWSPFAHGSNLTLAAPSQAAWLVETVSRPFSASDARATLSVATASARGRIVPFNLLFALWAAGFVAILATWLVRWRQIAALAHRGTRVHVGFEVEALRRTERNAGIRRPTDLIFCDGTLEPGVFGIIRPVLLWPSAISDSLSDEQIEAILAHEISHIRRRDNLTAALHMGVEAVFWFHPLVWWVGARLVDERERACDEDVIRRGSEPQVYAESILTTCRFSIESSLACVAGVTGADLKKRIEAIMKNHAGNALGRGKRLLLATTIVAAIAWPVAIGVMQGSQLRAQAQQTPAADNPSFEVASVKPNESGDPRVMIGGGPGGRFNASNVPLRMLIRNAYQLQDSQLVGGPAWLATERFDIVAKAEGNPAPVPPGSVGPMQLMMRNLLADRFKLVVHRETREQPIYALVLARSDGKPGPQLRKSEIDCAAMAAARGRVGGPPPGPPAPGERPQCGMRMGPGQLSGGGFPLSQLGTTLSQLVQRMVVDRTGLSGNFDIDLTWTPEPGQGLPPGPPPPGASALPPIDPNGPSLFTALQEQLGLKLDSQRGPVEVLVIDSVEMPTPD
jgi:uncharacterized protein (TIGR03435 family)